MLKMQIGFPAGSFKKLPLILLLLLLSTSLFAMKSKPVIITTLFPLYDFTRQIASDKAKIILLLPPGTEPHSFEPKPADVITINKADIFVYTGRHMEPWAQDLLKGMNNKSLLVVDASKGVKLMDADSDLKHEEEENEDRHMHAGKDPHIWLDLGNAARMVDNILAALIEKDPENRVFYLDNAGKYKARLNDLDRKFQRAFSNCRLRRFIYSGHFAFGYFAKRYNLNYLSPYISFSPDAEPTAKALVEMIKKIRQEGIKYIYYEELIDPKVARIISEETGAKILLLSGGHNLTKNDFSAGVTFIDIMEENLKNLKLGLECQ